MNSRFLLLAALLAIGSGMTFAQTNPSPQSLPYSQDFSSLAHASTTYPAGWQGWTISTSPGGSFPTSGPTADRTLTASSTAATTSGNVHNYDGKIGYLNSTSLDLTLVLALNTSGRTEVTVAYDIMTIRNPYDGSSNTRINEVTLQYRLGVTGSWTTLTGIEYQNNTTLQTSGTTPQNLQTKTIALPAECENQPVVQIRWASRQVSGVGSRPSFAVDNVSVTGTAATLPVVDGTITGGEYGSHVDGLNQETTGASVWYMSWDNGHLYIGISNANITEGAVLYLDKNPLVPINGGTNADGTISGFNYDGTSFSSLPFRADLVVYFKDVYREYRTADGAGGWSGSTTGFGRFATGTGNVREVAIPWVAIGGRPASFATYGYVTSSGGFVYAQVPTGNASGFIGTSARYEHYYIVSVTTVGSSTPPFSRNSFVFNRTTDATGFGALTVYDFTMNSSGRFLSRSHTSGGAWNVTGTMRVNAGTVYFGPSGGTSYGTTTVGTLIVDGGSLEMDYTNQTLNVTDDVSINSGALILSNSAGGDLALGGDFTRVGTFTPNNRAVTFLGPGAQALTGVTTFDYLTLNNPGGLVLNNNVTVNQGLNLTDGIISTGSSTLSLASGAIVSRLGGHVNGMLEKSFPTGSTSFSYHIGGTALYTPVALANFNVTTPGTVTATTTAGEHPDVGTSGIDASKNVNRYWTLTKDGSLAFTSYDATFFFDGSEIDGGASTSAFEVEKYDGSWSPLTVGIRTGTSTQVAGVTSFSDFIIGEAAVGLLDHFLVEAFGGGPIGAQTAGTPFTIRIIAQDASNNTVTSFTGTVDITSSGFLSAGGGTTASFVAGVLSSHSVTITNTGTFTITATETGDTPSGTSNAFDVDPGALNNFLVEAAGGGSIPTQDAGVPFNIQITARDAFNNTVTGFTSTVDITSSGILMSGGGTTSAFTAGVLASHAVAISNTGFFTITATHTFGPEFGTSNGFTVNVGPLDNFLVEAAGGGGIGTQTAGVPFDIQVTARDAGGNTVTSFTGTVDITSSGTLSGGGGTTGTFTAGVLSLHTVTITSAGTFTITATETGDTPTGTSNAFDVDPGPLNSFVVESAGGGALGTQTAGVPFGIDVTAVDAYGNTVTSFVGTVDITAGGPIASGGGTTPGFASGVLAAHSITINVAGSYTLNVEQTGGGPMGSSNPFTVDPGVLSKFLVEAVGGGPIGTQVAGTPFGLQVTAQDAFDNTVTTFSSTVEITSSGTLLSGGGTTAGFVAGLLASHTATISNTGNFTITATHTFGPENGSSNLFTVDPGPLDNYLVEAFGGGPIPSQVAGTPFDIQITARDAFNNTVPSFTGTVDVTSSGTLSAGGGTTGAFVLGILAPHSVTISNTGIFSITATTTGDTETGTGNLFTVDAGPLDHYLVEAAGGGVIGMQVAGTGFAIDITARDVNGNTVTGFSGTVDITSTGVLSVGGGTTGSFIAGVLAGHAVTITSAGTFDITATTTGGPETGTSNLFDVDPAALAKFAVEASGGGAIGTQTAGVPFAIQVTAQDAFDNTVVSFTGTVNITTGGTLVSGGGTTAAFVAGVLSPHNVNFSSAGMFDLTATATGGSETGTSNLFLVNPAALSTFLVEGAGGGPIGTQAVGVPFTIQITAKDVFGNTVPTFTGTTDITTSGSFISGGGTTVPFVAGFLASHAVNFATAGNFTITAKRTGGPELGVSNIFTVAPTFFTITATAGPNGTIFPSGAVLVAYGGNRTFTMTPDAGYQIDEVFVNGLPVGDDNTYTFINVVSDYTIHATFELNTKFLSIPPDSIVGKDPLTNKLYKPVRRGKGKMPNWANLLSETVIQGGFQPGATESDGAGGMRVGISHMDEVAPNKWKVDLDSARVRGWVRLTKWDFKKSMGKPFTVLQKTLKDRTGEHKGEARGFDYLGPETNPRPFLKQLTSLPPKRHNNELFAELVALKVNIAASQLGKTPYGFGELIYDNDGHPCDELSIVEISAKADTAMTYWQERDEQEYLDLFEAMYDINRAFVAELDTVHFEDGGQLVLAGEVDIDDVPFLKRGVIIARQLERTTDETEADEEDFEDEEFEDSTPVAAKLYQNYPNPFNPTTTIAFRLREFSTVSLRIFNMLGQEMATLLEWEEMDEGLQLLQFNAQGLATGVYFYRIEAKGMEEEGLPTVQTGKMLLIK